MPEWRGDEESGLIDTPWMGLVPTFMDLTMLNACNIGNTTYPTSNSNTKATIVQLTDDWETLKSLILGRATGLHRIVSTSGKAIEKCFTKSLHETLPTSPSSPAFSNASALVATSSTAVASSPPNVPPLLPIPQNSNLHTPITSRKRSVCDSDTGSSSSKKNKSTRVERLLISSANSKEPILVPSTPTESKICTGITCGRGAAFWCTKCNFEQSSIKQNVKQCQRCGRYMTALRKVATTMTNVLKETESSNIISSILQFCRENPSSLQFKYVAFMDLLDVYIPGKERAHQPRYTNKTISDRLKLICKVIHKSIIHHHEKLETNNSIFSQSLQFISKALIQFNNDLECCKSANKVNQDATPFLPHSSLIDKYSTAQKTHLNSQLAIDTNSANTYLGGGAINNAVDVIRARSNSNVFIAHADCYLSIKNWRIQQQWEEFGRIFSSQQVIDEKPLGTYIIPFFSGDNNRGHWHVIIVAKHRNCCQGWHIDSLGSATDQKELEGIIHKAFLPGRGRFIWYEHISTPQTECECGPRSILAIHSVEAAIAAGKSVEVAVEEASFLGISRENYSSSSVRLEAALLVDEHIPSMRTRLRRRNRTSDIGINNFEHRIKKRRIRGSKK